MTDLSQAAQILAALKRGQRINPLDALERFGCLRLAGRVFDLRQLGYPIETVTIHRNGKVFAEYRLPRKKSAA